MTTPTVKQTAASVHRVALARDYYEGLFGVRPRVFIRGGDFKSEAGTPLSTRYWLQVEPRTWGFISGDGSINLRRFSQKPFEFRLEA